MTTRACFWRKNHEISAPPRLRLARSEAQLEVMHGRKYGAAVSEVLRAFISEVEAPRRAIQQSNAEMTLERGEGPHHRRHASIQSG